ncbi:MAG TPA: hypothetical protein VFB68_19805 [Xanthobacteraceae bacterium]|nr:hypothetical protein [Xanthobacteraceae bacterium]
MHRRPYLPNYDPDFCLKVVKWGAAICLGWLTIGLLVLGLVDPSSSQCPGWTIYATNGNADSLWISFGLFTALPTIWICFVALRWEQFSQKIYDNAASADLNRNFIALPYGDVTTFPHNTTFVTVTIFWSLFCTAPLWMMLSNCTNLLRHWV